MTAAHLSIADISLSSIAERWQTAPLPDASNKAPKTKSPEAKEARRAFEAKEVRRAFASAFALDGVIGWWDHPASRRREWLLSLKRIREARARRESDRNWLLVTLRNYERCREAEGRPIAYASNTSRIIISPAL
jgi:hypothetical protein